ncbi:MAG: hypothetical protein QOE45_2568 [Frankiaceae bacterium]|jgi:ribulose-5-phosphate 4-epimerase/fuculose-1-phosphate aldolase|nr:hypothetical protein [Frankiaceae bacterium]
MTVLSRLDRATSFADLPPAAELVLLARVLDRMGFVEHNVGHITYKQPDDTLLTLPFQWGWDEVRVSDVMRIDMEGNVLEGRWDVTSAITLHLELHKARPNATIAIHNHPYYATIWAALRRIPPAYDQTSAACIESDLALYDDYEGAVIDQAYARKAVDALGDSTCALLANHGVFVIGDHVGQAYQRAKQLEWRCRTAWMVEAVGGGKPMPDYGVREMESLTRQYGECFPHQWEWAVRRELRADPDVLS